MERTTRRYGLGTRVFATDPWTVIRRSAERRSLASTRGAAYALLEQAEDFFRAAESGVKAARPLLLYYFMMNLAKAFILVTQQREDVNNAVHGVSERLDAPPNNQELINAWLEVGRTPAAGPAPPAGQKIKVFDELLLAISGANVAANNTRYDLTLLMPQIVPGHRLWWKEIRRRTLSASSRSRGLSSFKTEIRDRFGFDSTWSLMTCDVSTWAIRSSYSDLRWMLISTRWRLRR